MKRDIQISIIIPTYNRAPLILETLNSVLNQSISNWECIIVDDHSTDDTSDLVRKFINSNDSLKFIYLKNLRAKGAQGARNTGINSARSKWLMFLDSDDILKPYCIENRIATINANLGFDYYCFSTNALLPDGSIQSKYELKSDSLDDIIQFLKFQNPWHTMGCVINKSVIDAIGHWDENFSRSQDSEFYLRLVLCNKIKGFKAISIPFDTLFRMNYCRNGVSQANLKSLNVQETYYNYLTKVRSQLEYYNIWNQYKNYYLYFAFYIYSNFLISNGKMNERFLKLYVSIIEEFNINIIKKIIYQIYFLYRGSKLINNNFFLRIIFKSIPKLFELPYSKSLLW